MDKYRFLPHTADGKFQAFGKTLEEAFGNAALAVASLVWDWEKIEPKVRHFVHVRGIDREQVLVKFLGEDGVFDIGLTGKDWVLETGVPEGFGAPSGSTSSGFPETRAAAFSKS